MTDRSLRGKSASAAPADGRGRWSPPRVRSLKTSAAENGPNFPTADGIEGQS